MDIKISSNHNNSQCISRPIVDNNTLIPVPGVKNVVGMFSCGIELKLDYIVAKLKNAEYNPSRYNGCVFKLFSPKITTMIFSTGKIIVTGASSEDMCKLGSQKLVRILRVINLPVKLHNFRIINMVGRVNLKFPVRLEGIVNANIQKVQYEPELFPAVFYQLFSPKMTFLIFVNGEVIITGATSNKFMIEAFNNVYPILRQYRKMK